MHQSDRGRSTWYSGAGRNSRTRHIW